MEQPTFTPNSPQGDGNQDTIRVLSPREFIAAAEADITAVLLDVRRLVEYESGHLEGAILLDWQSTESFLEGLSHLDKSRTYYVYCRSGKRSHAATSLMQAEGFRVVDMQGGILHWQELGLPTVR